jgi:hypothetical protein
LSVRWTSKLKQGDIKDNAQIKKPVYLPALLLALACASFMAACGRETETALGDGAFRPQIDCSKEYAAITILKTDTLAEGKRDWYRGRPHPRVDKAEISEG